MNHAIPDVYGTTLCVARLLNQHRGAQEDYLDACLLTCLQIHEDEKGDGDVLVFLPGQDDIEALSQLLRDNLATLRAEKSRYCTVACVVCTSVACTIESSRVVQKQSISKGL